MAKETTNNEIQHIMHNDTSGILGAPRITEKAALATGGHVYTFNVPLTSNKIEIKRAVKNLYKVDPIKVNVVRMRPITKIFRGRMGTSQAFKKAMVYLKKGDTIEL